MAEDAINAAVATKRIPWAGPCGTKGLAVVGTAGWNSTLFTEVAQNYTVPHRPGAIDTRVAKHLAGQCCQISLRSDLKDGSSLLFPRRSKWWMERQGMKHFATA